MPLSDTRIRSAKATDAPSKLSDAKGLYLEVRPTGAKLWRYRYKLKDEAGKFKEYLYALGEYMKAPDGESAHQASLRRSAGQFTLEEARTRAPLRLRGLVKQGLHPITQRRAEIASVKAEAANTFETFGQEWLTKMEPHWSADYYRQVEAVLQKDVFPEVGPMPIRQVSARMIGQIMEKVVKRGAVPAINLRQWCSSIFAHAVRKQAADGDPTTVLKGLVKSERQVKHKTPLTQEQIPVMLQKVQHASSLPQTKIALQLLLRLFVRPIEVRRAEWNEFDLSRHEWVIPAHKMKKREKHVIPLPHQSIQDLREPQIETGRGRWLFPNTKRPDAHMSRATLNKVLRAIGYEREVLRPRVSGDRQHPAPRHGVRYQVDRFPALPTRNEIGRQRATTNTSGSRSAGR